MPLCHDTGCFFFPSPWSYAMKICLKIMIASRPQSGTSRVLNSIVLFIFPIPRINNTENNTIQEYSILTKIWNSFLILLHFSPFQTILSIFWKSPFLGPEKAHIMGIWAENHPFGVFSYKCLELSNSSRNGIKIQSWIVLNSIE